jgi:hypothetical protein
MSFVSSCSATVLQASNYASPRKVQAKARDRLGISGPVVQTRCISICLVTEGSRRSSWLCCRPGGMGRPIRGCPERMSTMVVGLSSQCGDLGAIFGVYSTRIGASCSHYIIRCPELTIHSAGRQGCRMAQLALLIIMSCQRGFQRRNHPSQALKKPDSDRVIYQE